MLATSRVPLDITGEHCYPISSFVQAAELFRRRTAHRGAPLHDNQHSEAVARVCELVGHLPLAIEIAAAQTPYRTVQEIADELERGIVHRDAAQPERRHETMSAAIRWSHELLDVAAADALVRLGVFSASFLHSDAAAVIEPGDTRDVLDTLVRNSLIERSDDDGRSKYRLAVPVQQYCAAELERRGATTEVLLALAEWLLEFTDRPYGDVWWRLSAIDEVNPRLPHALSAIAALRAVDRIDDATRLASRLGGAARMFGHADQHIALLTELWPSCDDDEATADALVALVLCADIARRRKIVNQAVSHLADLDGPIGRQHRVFVHCENSLVAMWAALLSDADFEQANDELRRARDHAEALHSRINRAHVEMWQSGVHLLAGDWVAAEAAARRSLEDSVDTTFDLFAASFLCHARLQLGDPNAALQLANRHPQRNRYNPHGNVLGIVAAIARVQGGQTLEGLTDISHIQRQARQAPFRHPARRRRHHDCLRRPSHGPGRPDLADSRNRRPWVRPLDRVSRTQDVSRHAHTAQGHVYKSGAERQERSVFYGTIASRMLNQLCERQAQNSAPPSDGT